MNLWCDEQILVHIESPDGERDVVVPQPMARIGSHPDSQIVLSGPGIAKRALYLHATTDGIYALNLDLEDTKLDERGHWITDDQPLLVGLHKLTVRTASGTVASPTQPDLVASKSDSSPIPVLGIHCGRLLKDRRRFRSPLSILGRRPQCSLQLRGLKVSSFHCALYWHERQLWCIDLLSSNGTTLNGEPLDCGEVRLNDRLDVGEFGLVYYRWSPRLSMSPGWEAGLADRAGAHAAGSEPAHVLSPAASTPPPPPADESAALAQWNAERQQLRDQWAAEVAELNRQCAVEKQRWEEAALQLAAQAGEMQSQATSFAEQRVAWAAASQQLQQDRDRLAQALADQSQRLARLESELATTNVDRDGELQAAQSMFQQVAAQLLDRQDEANRLAEDRNAVAAALREGEHQCDELTRQLAERSQQLARLESQLAAATLERECQRQAEQQHAQQAAAAMEAQLRDMQDEAGRLGEHCKSLEAACREWTQERNALMEESAQRAQQMARLEADLAAAKSALTRPTTFEPAHCLAPAAEDQFALPAASHAFIPEPRIQQMAPTALDLRSTVVSDESLSDSERSAPSETIADTSEARVRTLSGTVIEGRGGPPAAGPETGRRRGENRDELTSLVNSRLIELEREKRPHPVVVWSVVGVVALTLTALALGLWGWMS